MQYKRKVDLMDLQGMAPQIAVTVTLSDLENFANYLISSAKEDLEDNLRAKDDERLVGTDAACERLGVHRATLYRWEKRGMLNPIYLGRHKAYFLKEINEFIENSRRTRS